MKFGIVGPISKDRVIWPNGETASKFGAVVYTATVLARLLEGTKDQVICLSHISPDHFAEIAGLLEHPNISLAGVAALYKSGTEIDLSYVDEQERISCQTKVMTPITRGELHALLDCDSVIFMPLNETDIPLKELQDFRRRSVATIFLDIHGLITAVDSSGKRFKKHWQDAEAWLACIDILKMNDKEASWAAGYALTRLEDYLQYSISIVKSGLTACWITFGDQSSLIVWQRRGRLFWASVPVTQVEQVLDTIGCGDSASAGFIYAYARLHSPLFGVVMGNMLGSVKASIVESSDFPSRPEVRSMIARHYRDYLHNLVDDYLSQSQLIVHEIKEELIHEDSLYSSDGHRYRHGTDLSRGSHSQGPAAPWS